MGIWSRLGAASPEVQIAEQVKKLREDWRPVAYGQRRLKADAYTQADREREAERVRALREARKNPNDLA